MKHYPELESSYIWERYADFFDDELEHDEISMLVLGQEMNRITQSNRKLQQRIVRILDDAKNEVSRMLFHLIVDNERETLQDKFKVREHIKQGFTK